MRAGLHARTSITSYVFTKSLKLNMSYVSGGEKPAADKSDAGAKDKRDKKVAKGETAGKEKKDKDKAIKKPAANLLNLQTTDAKTVELMFWMCMYLWASPLQAVIALYLLYSELGWTVVAGTVVLLLLIPVQACFVKASKKATQNYVAASDTRVKQTSELVQGIRMVKFSALEPAFSTRIGSSRVKELKGKRWSALLDAFNNTTTQGASLLAGVASIGLYSVLGDAPLTPSKAFASLMLFNVLKMPLFVLPMTISYFVAGSVSLKRLNDFFGLPELSDYVHRAPESVARGEPAIVVDAASFTWTASGPQTGENTEEAPIVAPIVAPVAVLEDLSFKCDQGSLTWIAAGVGGGKSSVLAALLGEMTPIAGIERGDTQPLVTVAGRVAFCGQTAWIQNGTLRDNILFGQPFDQARYDEAIAACVLQADLDALPAGDLTEIGEEGINLSGGQRQRVALARAVYANADVYLLDDVLSAVDAHVGAALLHNCILGLLVKSRGACVVLASHQQQFKKHAHQLLVLEERRLAFVGPPPKMLGIAGEPSAEDEDEVPPPAYENPVAKDADKGQEALWPASSKEGEVPTEGVVKDEDVRVTVKDEGDEGKVKGKLIHDEDREMGRVQSQVYLRYMRICGPWFISSVVLFLVLQTGTTLGVNLWLAHWSEQTGTNGDNSVFYVGVYCALAVASLLFICCYLVLSVYAGINAATGLHNTALQKIMRAPTSFYDQTPAGRLMNRFTVSAVVQSIYHPMLHASPTHDLRRETSTRWINSYTACCPARHSRYLASSP
jgi:ABC-type multidrug transport system fused ATPase/permease subunit